MKLQNAKNLGRKNQWTNEQLEAAMKDVKSKQLSASAAARKYGIPPSTLHDHLSGKSTKRYGGPPTILTAKEEKEIERVCQVMHELGFPLTKDFVSVALREYLDATCRAEKFKDGIPGYDWWWGFLKRHPKLAERKPEHFPRNRAEASRPEVNNDNKLHVYRNSNILPLALTVDIAYFL